MGGTPLPPLNLTNQNAATAGPVSSYTSFAPVNYRGGLGLPQVGGSGQLANNAMVLAAAVGVAWLIFRKK